MLKNPFATNCFLFASVGLALLVGSAQLRAQTSTWIGGGADPNWSTAANWQGGALPFPGSSLVFQGSGTGSFLTPNNSVASFFISSLGFGSGTGNFTISGQQISLGSGGISSTRSGISTITADLALASSTQSWTLASGSTVELDGVLSGTAPLTLAGSGTLVLGGSNTYAGSVSVTGGTLRLANTNALASAFFTGGTLSYGTLTTASLGGLAGSSDLSTQNDTIAPVAVSVGGNNFDSNFSGAITGTGTINKIGTGKLTLSNPNSTSAMTLSAGTLAASASNALGTGTFTINGGTLALANGNTLNLGGLAGTGNLSLNTQFNQPLNLTVGGNNVSTTFSGSLTSTVSGSSITKAGTGTLTLSGSSAFIGSVSISAGTLKLANQDALSGAIYTPGTGTLSFGTLTAVNLGAINGSGTVVTQNDNSAPVNISAGGNNQSTSFSGVFTGTGSFIKIGTGTLTLSNSSSTAAITLSAGTIVAQQANALGSGTFTINGGTLSLASSNTLTLGGLAGSGTLALNTPGNQPIALTVGGNNASTTFSGSFTSINPGASLTKVGTGILTLSGSNLFGGSVSISAGTLQLANADALAGPTYIPAAGTLSFGTLTAVNLGAINGSGTIGTQNDNSSPVNVSAGGNNQSTSFSGAFTGSGSLIKTGTGTLTLSAPSSTAAITLSAGAIVAQQANALGSGTFTINGGTLSLASGNTLTLGGLAGSGTLVLDAPSSQPIALTVGGNNASTTFSGSLTSTLSNASLTKTGTGTLTLSGTNPFGGSVSISAGTLKLANQDALSGSTYSPGSGTLSFGTLTAVNLGAINGSGTIATQNDNNSPVNVSAGGNNQSTSFLGAFTGTGSLIKTGTGTLTLSAPSSTAAITLSAGTIVAQQANALGSGTFTINGGTLSLASGNTLTLGGLAGSGTLVLDAPSSQPIALTVGGNNASTTFAGSLISTLPNASLTKVGTGTLTLSGTNPFGGSVSISAGTLKLANQDALSGPTYSPGSGTLSFGTLTAVNLGAISSFNGALVFNTQNDNLDPVVVSIGANGQNTSYTGTFAGSGTIQKVGAGTLTLSIGNTGSTAAITLAAGTIVAQQANALGSGTFTINGGSLSLPNGNTLTLGGLAGSGALALVNPSNVPIVLTVGSNNLSTTFSGSLTNTGSLDKTGTGTLTLSTANTFTGLATADTGTLRLADPNALGGATYFPGSGTLSFGTLSAANLGGISGTGNLVTRNDNSDPVNISAGGNNQNSSFSGSITGPGIFEKTGTGTLTFSGTLSTSNLQLTAGTLSIGSFNALGTGTLIANGGSLTVTAGTALTLGGLAGAGTLVWTNPSSQPLDVTVGGNNTSTTFSGKMSGTGTFTKTGTGTLTLSGANTFSGIVSASTGAIALGASATLSQATFQTNANTSALSFGTLSSASLAAITGAGTINTENTLSDPVDLTVGGTDANFAFSGALTGPGSLIKTGFGTLTLSGFSNTAAITLNNGAIAITQGSALGSGVFSINNSASLSFGTLTAASAGSISGNGSIALRNSSNSPVTFTVGGNNASTTFSGHFSGVGSLQKTGSGTLTLTGTSTHSGSTLVSGGTLLVENSTGSALGTGSVTISAGVTLGGNGSFSGPVSLSGVVSPGIPAGGPGTLSVGATTLHSGGSYLWEISDAAGTPGTGWDLLSTNGTLDLGSLSAQGFTLQIESLSGVSSGFAANWDPGTDHTWIFASATGIASFNSARFVVDASGFLNPVGPNSSWSITQVGSNLQLNFTAIPEPAATGTALGLLLLVVALARRRR